MKLSPRDYKNRSEFLFGLSSTQFNWLITKSSCVIPKYKVLYVSTPKVACTKIKMLLFSLGDYPLPDNWHQIHSREELKHCPKRLAEFSLKEQEKILFGDDWYRFTFVRNPYDRAL